MGNISDNPQQIPFPSNPTLVRPIGSIQSIGLTAPQTVLQSSYASGIANAGYYDEFDRCCDCTPSYAPTPGLVPGGYGINPGFSQYNYGDACCGLGQSLYIVQTPGKGMQPVPSQMTQVMAPMQTSLVKRLSIPISPIKQVIPSSTSIGASIVSSSIIPSSQLTSPDLMAKLSPKILAIIQNLNNINPLRGSVLNRLDAPQYIPQKHAYYEGQWSDGYMNGFGKLYFNNGGYFEGQFVQGNAFTQQGLFVYPDGSYYLGGVSKNCANGQGTFNYRNGKLVYKGTFLNDQPDGAGTQTYSDGSSYQGDFRFGKKQGRGRFTWTDGTTYSGSFENGFMQGEGIHKLSNGDIYEGELRKNKRHGKGRLTTPLGVYFGNFRKDSKEGSGQFSWKDGRAFKGTFKGGKPDGPGCMTLNTGQIVYGLWLDGVVDPKSLSVTNPFGSSLDLRGSIVSNASMTSLILPVGIARGSQIMNGPPILNLPGGMINQGFMGSAVPSALRGSTLSVLGPGSYNPRTSSFGMGLSRTGLNTNLIPNDKIVQVPFNPRVSNTAIVTTFTNPPKTMIIRT